MKDKTPKNLKDRILIAGVYIWAIVMLGLQLFVIIRSIELQNEYKLIYLAVVAILVFVGIWGFAKNQSSEDAAAERKNQEEKIRSFLEPIVKDELRKIASEDKDIPEKPKLRLIK